MGVTDDRVDVLLSFPPRYSISKAVGIMRSISASAISYEHPEVKKHLFTPLLIPPRYIFYQSSNAVFSKCQEKCILPRAVAYKWEGDSIRPIRRDCLKGSRHSVPLQSATAIRLIPPPLIGA